MSDAEEIIDLLLAYGTAFDSRDPDAFVALFTDDAVLVSPDGREMTGLPTFRKIIENTPPGGTHYPEPPHVLHLDGDEATATSSYRAELAGGAELNGRYEDVVRRTKDGWRIARRAVFMDA